MFEFIQIVIAVTIGIVLGDIAITYFNKWRDK